MSDCRYFVDDLQAVEPDELAEAEGIVVTVSPEKDSQGFDRVEVEGPTREAVVAYVRDQWGTDDEGWIQEWVVDRILPRPIDPPAATIEPRDHEAEILCHLNISLPVGSTTTVETVEQLISGALEVGLEGNDDVPDGMRVAIAITEEI